VILLGDVDEKLIWKLAALLNRLNSVQKASKELGWSTAKTSRLIRSLIKKGVLSRHMIIPLELFDRGVNAIIVEKNQKTGVSCFKKPLDTLISYYSFTKSPVYVFYSRDTCSTIEESIDYSLCKLLLCETVKDTLTPLEDPETPRVVFIRHKFSQPIEIPANAKFLLLELLRTQHLPEASRAHVKELLAKIAGRTGMKSVKHYYYTYLRKYLIQHYSTRFSGDHLLIHATALCEEGFVALLNSLLQSKLISGYIQLHLLSRVPLEAIIHAWGFYERFIDDSNTHPYIKKTSYYIYPVYGVAW
jgi:hypothetical protein